MESLAEKGFSFNDLEKEIYRISCEYGSKLMTEILQTIDKDISNSRDKSEYRHKGIKKTTIKTLMGEVTYGRVVYETKTETGEEASVFLLDKELKIDTYGKISSNLAAKIAECVSVSSYRETAEKVSSMTGQTISHGGVWNVVQELGSARMLFWYITVPPLWFVLLFYSTTDWHIFQEFFSKNPQN